MKVERERSYLPGACRLLLAGVLLSGCSTVMKRGGGGEITTVPEGFNTPQELVQELNFALRTEAGDRESEALANLIERLVAGRMLATGCTMKPTAADLLVELTVRQKLFDQSGEFVLLEGEVDGSLKRLYDSKLLAHDRVTAKGKRELGLDKAVSSLADELGPRINEWVDKACQPARIPLAACQVDVMRSWMTSFTPGSRLNAEYATRFVKAVTNMQGVLRCELTDEEPNERLLRFRIVYLKEQYPAGLLNTIMVQHPELKLKR